MRAGRVIPPRQPCRRCLARLSAYLERELSPATRDVIRRHMVRCSNCRVVLRTLKKTVALCRQTPGRRLPRTALRRVLAALRGELARCQPPAS